jgi:replicative superfamily II helicase
LSAQTLARQAEFARLGSLARDFEAVGKEFELDRPFLAATILAIAAVLSDFPQRALALLRSVLGFDGASPPHRVRRSREHLLDLLIANAVRIWVDEDQDTSRLTEARRAALESGHASALALAELMLEYSRASREYSVVTVVQELEPSLRDKPASTFLHSLTAKRLFSSQRRVLEQGLLTAGSAVLSIPTGAGKTLLSELRIVAQLQRQPGKRAIYLAPYKVLARQVEERLRKDLRLLGLTARDLGADFDIREAEEIAHDGFPDVGIMTPERCDALLRLASSERAGAAAAREFLDSVTLIVLDEAHLITRVSRGPRLELFILRLRQLLPGADVLALSAILEVGRDLAEWFSDARFHADTQRPTGRIEILWDHDGELLQRHGDRTVRLTAIERADTAYKDAARLALRFRREYYPVLVLETSRQYAESVVREMLSRAPREGERFRQTLFATDRAQLDAVADDARAALGQSHDLPRLIRNGLAYHHAGLPPSLLRGLESLASRRLLRALASTTTVAEGANLPFRVVIIPHLNFYPSRKLERDLYDNIIGRAGRPGTAHEGLVVILGTSAPTLRRLVRSELWSTKGPSLSGRISGSSADGRDITSQTTHRQVEGQVLAWLGEAGSYMENQATVLAERTFSWQTARRIERERLEEQFSTILANLEESGLAIAASPYRLTALGTRSRLAGLSPQSCVRLDHVLSRAHIAFLTSELTGARSLDSDILPLLVPLVFETEEVIQCSLWFRHVGNEAEKAATLRRLISGEQDWPSEDAQLEIDISLLSHWVSGASFEAIGRAAPAFQRGIFSGESAADRAADAAEYIIPLGQKASWAWSAAAVLLGDRAADIPLWIRRAFELGVPTETAAELISRIEFSRSGALALATALPPMWHAARGLLEDEAPFSWDVELPISDANKLRAWVNRRLRR